MTKSISERLKSSKPLLLLAPMAEITHRGFRELIERQGGCDIYFGEMISAASLCNGGAYEKYYWDGGPDINRSVAQLVGNRSDLLCRAANILADKGFKNIDLNLGCSAPDILKKGNGAALLRNPKELIRLVGELRTALPSQVELSAKLRLGDSIDGEFLVNLGKALEDQGLAFMTLHPKTTRQKPSRPAYWDKLALLQDAIQIPLIANGGITSPTQWQNGIHQTGVLHWMIGRAAVEKPWIFSQIQQLQKSEQACLKINLQHTLENYFELLTQHQPEDFHLSRGKRFSSYFYRNLKYGYQLHHSQIHKAEELSEIQKLYQDYFLRNPKEIVKVLN